MAFHVVTDTQLTDLADVIRLAGGTEDALTFPDGFINAIGALPSEAPVQPSGTLVPWSTGTDEQIVAMLQAAHNGDIDLQTDGGWAVGDVRTITVGAFTAGGSVSVAQQDIDIVISSFDDYMSCGCVMQFDFKDALAEGVRMNPSNSNNGGWGSSEMKTVTMPALVNALPTWLKNSLIEFSVLASTGQWSLVTVTGNKLALRSEKEVTGDTTYSYYSEGAQLQFYITYANHYKKCGHSGSNCSWWLRSAYNDTSTKFVHIYTNGRASSENASYAYRVAPFGCL